MLITQESYTPISVDVRLPLSDDMVRYHSVILQEFGHETVIRILEDAVRDAIVRKYIETFSL